MTGRDDWPEIPEEPPAPRFVIQLGVTVDVTADAEFGEVSRWWLRRVGERFEPVLASEQRLLRGGVTRFGATSLGGGGDWSAALTPKSWEGLLDSLDEAVGDGSLYLEQTEPVVNGAVSSVRAMVMTDSGEWAECFANVGVVGESVEDLPASVGEHLQGLLMDCAGHFLVTFAQTTKGGWMGKTPLESALRRSLEMGLAESPHVLRGYDWVTFAPSAVLDRVGGASVLRASGSFAEVVSTAGGAVLRATDRYHQYDDAAADKVFGALACGLPAGMPKVFTKVRHRQTSRLVDEDASERCASRMRPH